jgi:hypothetical protein
MTDDHMDSVYAPFEASSLPWLDTQRAVLLDPIDSDDPLIVAAIGGTLKLGPGAVITPVLLGVAFSVETAGQFLDAITASAERDGLGPGPGTHRAPTPRPGHRPPRHLHRRRRPGCRPLGRLGVPDWRR